MINVSNPMEQYPINDLNALTVDSMECYAALVLGVAGVDGLHQSEEAAFERAMKNSMGDGFSLEKIRVMAAQPLVEIVKNQDVLRVLAPYVLRDAVRVAQADGVLSDSEMRRLRDSAAALDVSNDRLESIVAAVQFDRKMRVSWTYALQGK
jgi:tellurite resistance protein